ncbi:signal peptide peptidase SppA [Corallococcus sp. H22C18031201]|nr:signal peptide peptidase SppA [Corallococcus sp. H22C18031201]
MLRLPLVAFANLLLLVRLLLGLPWRLLARRHRPAWVRFRLTGAPAYREPRRRWAWLGGARPEPATVTSLAAFRAALQGLAADPRVRGVLLEVEALSVPLARREALIRSLEDFRAAGKRVVAWAVAVDTDAYPVLCAADEVLLAPMGRVELVGYAAEATVLGEALKRFGVQAQFVRRGDYKTAPELFTHAAVSDIQRQTIEALLDERYAVLVDAVARGRRRTPDEARALIDAGPYSARRALAAGLVDALVSEADLPARLGLPATEPGEDAAPLEPFAGYLETRVFPPVRWLPVRRRPRLGLVPVSGVIVGGGAGRGRFAASEAVVKSLRRAGRDPRVRAVLLHVSSPGGGALPSEQILEAVRRVAVRKPVVAYMDSVCASGGYMAALGARELWSAPYAVVGSIGVFIGKFECSELLEWFGVRRTVITRGQNAGFASAARGFTPHERATLEAEVEESYQSFLETVAEARGRTKEEIHARAEGRVYSGLRARDAGLVDRIGGFEEACRRALELAGQGTQDFELVQYGAAERRLSLVRLLSRVARVGTYALCPLALGLESWDEEEPEGALPSWLVQLWRATRP